MVFEFFKALLWGESYMGSWFIHASWIGMISLSWMLRHCNKIFVHIICTFCFLLALIDTSYQFLISETGLVVVWQFINKIVYPSESFIMAIPYFYVGKVISEKERKTSIWCIIFCVFLLFFEAIILRRYSEIDMMLNPRFEQFLSLLPLALYMVWWLRDISWKIPKQVSILMRQQSILIFLLHQPLIIFTYRLTSLSMGCVLYVAVIIESILLSSLIIRISPKINVFKYLY